MTRKSVAWTACHCGKYLYFLCWRQLIFVLQALYHSHQEYRAPYFSLNPRQRYHFYINPVIVMGNILVHRDQSIELQIFRSSNHKQHLRNVLECRDVGTLVAASSKRNIAQKTRQYSHKKCEVFRVVQTEW